MRETICMKATVYIRQEIEYHTKAERSEKIEDIQGQVALDLSSMQDGGCSEYDYRFDGSPPLLDRSHGVALSSLSKNEKAAQMSGFFILFRYDFPANCLRVPLENLCPDRDMRRKPIVKGE